MRKIYCCLGSILLWSLLNNPAQGKPYTSHSARAIQLYEQGLRHHLSKQHRAAARCLTKALAKDERFVEAYLQLATVQQEQNNVAEAKKLLGKAQHHLPPNKPPALCHQMAWLHYRAGAYAKAQEVLALLPALSSLPTPLRARVDRLQQDVAFSLEQIKNPSTDINPKLLPLPLNQFTSQYLPVLTIDQNTLLFTARADLAKDKETIYISQKDAAGHWTVPRCLTDKIPQTHNAGACTISADGKTLIFAAAAGKRHHGVCDLYIMHKQGDEWSMPSNLGPHINSLGWESQPSLTADGRTLYFVSDRAGNYGKKDIWKSTLQDDGGWTVPVNLGPTINSKGRELSPFIHPNGQTLFFASNRCPSLGGFDIYYSNWVDGEWTTPVNLGYPINKYSDQTSLFVTADGQKAYYAAGNQKGTSYYNSYLYVFDFPPELVQFPKSDFIRLQIADAQTDQATAAQVEVYDLATDTRQASLPVAQEDGEALVVVNEGKTYGIFVKKKGYLFESIHVSYKQGDKPVVTAPAKVLLKPIATDQSQILNNVFFSFDQHKLAPCSTTELNRLVEFLQAHPALHIAIEGHTDQVGSVAYNNQLALKRARAIYNYLVAGGIGAKRLTYVGYGKSRPIAPQNAPAGRHRNRRVAFKIVK